MRSIEQPQLLLDRCFSDSDELASSIEWDFDFRQLEAGPLRARAALMGTSRTIVMRVELDRAFHQAGTPPAGMLTFGLPYLENGPFKWCGKDAHGGDILNFNLDGGFDGVSKAGFAGFSISIRETLMQEVSEILELNFDYRKQIRATDIWTNANQTTNRLRQRLFAAYDVVPSFSCPDAQDLFDFSAAALLLEFLSGQDISSTRVIQPFRSQALRMTMEWMNETGELPLTVMELCTKTGFSAPTLYRAFSDEFGVGPKRYLHVRRLAGVRRDLRSSHITDCISDIAARWGFWHMGKFAADYRRQYGELPSDTRGCQD